MLGSEGRETIMSQPLITNGQALAVLQDLYALADEWDRGGGAIGLAWSVAAEQLRSRLDRLIIADLGPRLCPLERDALRRSGVAV